MADVPDVRPAARTWRGPVLTREQRDGLRALLRELRQLVADLAAEGRDDAYVREIAAGAAKLARQLGERAS